MAKKDSLIAADAYPRFLVWMSEDPNRQFAVDVVQQLRDAGYESLWAGGCVRDLLLGREPKDYDVATTARPDDVRQLFGHRRTLAVGASFGVIIVLGPRGVNEVEVATFRTEGPYRDGRRPEHVSFATPEEDAHRRDFTINGMFYDPLSQTVHDYVDGEADLGAGIIRAIGDPQARMEEDKLRMLRAVRFTANLDFELDAATAGAVRGMADQLTVVSAERIAQELRRMLVDPHRKRAVELMRELDLLPRAITEFASLDDEAWQRTLHMLHLLESPSFELAATVWWHGLEIGKNPADAAKSLGKRLRLSNKEIDDIGWLWSHQHALDDAESLPLCRLKPILAHPLATDLLALLRVRLLATNADLHSLLFCEEYLLTTPREELDPPPLLTGDDLIHHGFQPGKQFKVLLDRVRNAQLNGEIATREEGFALLANDDS